MAPLSALAAPVILLILLQVVWLQSAQALNIPQRRDRYTMNPNVATWHRSCDEPNPSNPHETKQKAVERAWSGALELIDSAWHRFDRQTYPKVSRVFLSEGTEREISDHSDPGYVLGVSAPLIPFSRLWYGSVTDGSDELVDTLYCLRLIHLQMAWTKSAMC